MAGFGFLTSTFFTNPPGTDTGTDPLDWITSDTTLTLSGTAQALNNTCTLGIWISGGTFGNGASPDAGPYSLPHRPAAS